MPPSSAARSITDAVKWMCKAFPSIAMPSTARGGRGGCGGVHRRSTKWNSAAQALGKWVHVGRVNHAERWQHFEELGVDSVDGTGLSRYSRMRFGVADRHLQENML